MNFEVKRHSFKVCTATLSLQDAWGRDENTAYGDVEHLDREGDCWVVTISFGFETLVSYLNPESGDILFAWAIPEG